ncbi:MAG: 6-phosphogluconolactonase [Mariprofundaceae bacterium]|nr:6-phosphogluconolactonase [Mariprofundaceae bacterium]
MNIHRFNDAAQLAEAVAQRVVAAASEAIMARGLFHWALAGGTTPRLCYEQLRDAGIDWRHVHVWFGDERCLPAGDHQRNDVMADDALLRHVPIPAGQIHRIRAELGPERGAELYATALAEVSDLDLVLLGMGEDGHTASLFPGSTALKDRSLAVPVINSPKPPAQRVSMGNMALKAARSRIILVTGEAKRKAFERVCHGEDLPVNIAASDWYVAF